jgi:hypothetical protein
MRLDDVTTEAIQLSPRSAKAQSWIDKVYDLYPQTWQNNHVMPLGGQGDDQQFAMFELVPSLSKRDAVEVKWFQAYPQRQGVGTRAMRTLQDLAQQDGIALTLYPWDKGQVSQAKLTRFYKGTGFLPTAKGAKTMAWEPSMDEAKMNIDRKYAAMKKAQGGPPMPHPYTYRPVNLAGVPVQFSKHFWDRFLDPTRRDQSIEQDWISVYLMLVQALTMNRSEIDNMDPHPDVETTLKKVTTTDPTDKGTIGLGLKWANDRNSYNQKVLRVTTWHDKLEPKPNTIRVYEDLAEGLTHKDPVEKWVAVFKASKHPKFAGKTPEQREKMARMAQYRAVQNKKTFENMDHSKDAQAVPELKAALLSRKRQIKKKAADKDAVYDIINGLMTSVAKAHGISGQKLHDMWVDQYGEIPDTWILHESALPGSRTPTEAVLAKKYTVGVAEVKRQLKKGTKVEMEHTTDPAIAREIALDHLGENLYYYDLLDKAGLEEAANMTTAALRDRLNKLMAEDQTYADPTQRAPWQEGVWRFINANKAQIFSDLGPKGNGDYPAAPFAAWLLVQHMDAHPERQAAFYKLLKSAIPNHPKLQFLRDRAAVNQWILQHYQDPEYYHDGKPLTNPTADVRDHRLFKDAGIKAKSRQEALENAVAAGNKLLVAAVKATGAKTQPSYTQQTKESLDEAWLDMNEYGGWITPDRKVEYVPFHGHEDHLRSEHGMRLAQAFLAGFVRFATNARTGTFSVEGMLPALRKTYRIWGPTALNARNVYVDIFQWNDDMTEQGLTPHMMFRPGEGDKPQIINSFGTKVQTPIAEAKKKRAKTIIDGMIKTLIKQGRTRDEAIADLKKQVDSRFYEAIDVLADEEILEENLRDWFKQKWVRFGPDGKIRGACARGSDSEGKPKCLPAAKAHALGKKKRATAARRKRREDPNPERHGKAKNVRTKESVAEQTCPHCGGAMYEASMMSEKRDACYYKVKSRYKVWPSAYASGALVQCRKRGAKNWGKSKAEESVMVEDDHREKMDQLVDQIHDAFHNGVAFDALEAMEDAGATVNDDPRLKALFDDHRADLADLLTDELHANLFDYRLMNQIADMIESVGILMPDRQISNILDRKSHFINSLVSKNLMHAGISEVVMALEALENWGLHYYLEDFVNLEDGKDDVMRDLLKLYKAGLAREVAKIVKRLREEGVDWPELVAIEKSLGAGTTMESQEASTAAGSSQAPTGVIFNGNTAYVGQTHGKSIKLSDNLKKRIQDMADSYGAWYEGNGADRAHTKDLISKWQGSWDDLAAASIKGYPPEFLYVLFANVDANDTIGRVGTDPNETIFNQILKNQESGKFFPDRSYDAATLRKFLGMVSQEGYDFNEMAQQPATAANVKRFFKTGEQLMWPSNWAEYPNPAGKVAKKANDHRDKWLATRKSGVYVMGSGHLLNVAKLGGFKLIGGEQIYESSASTMNETRQGAWKWLKSYLPTWPEYVLRDWIYNHFRGEWDASGDDPKTVIQRTLDGEGMTPQTRWKFVPDFHFTFDSLDPDTVRRIKERQGGAANPYGIPKDAERHATQAKLAAQQGGVRDEPVILKKVGDKYELIEGWHRTIQHFKQFPDGYKGPAWIALDAKPVSENFADGRGPGRPGDSQRHGIPKGATMAQLQKAAKAPGRKGQLARWQINMRRGRAKAHESEEPMTADQWQALRKQDPRSYLGIKDYRNRKWWESHFKAAMAKARVKGDSHFEFPPGTNMWYMVTKNPLEETDGPPHGTPENELAMMKAGTKPAALIADHTWHELYEPIMDQHSWVVKKWRLPADNFTFYTIGQPGEEARIKRIGQLIYQANAQPGGFSTEYHRELGRLLGYSEADIDSFVKDIQA